jgi:hypothetical protein
MLTIRLFKSGNVPFPLLRIRITHREQGEKCGRECGGNFHGLISAARAALTNPIFFSCHGGACDIDDGKVWDTGQIERPEIGFPKTNSRRAVWRPPGWLLAPVRRC